MPDRGGRDERVDRRGCHTMRQAAAPEPCSRNVVWALEWQQTEWLEAAAQPTGGPLTPEALEDLLKDDPEQEYVLAMVEDGAQLPHGRVVGRSTLSERKGPD